MHYDLWARDSCIGGALRSDFGGAGLHRYECSDRQRDDKPDVRFGANTDHDKTWRRANLGNCRQLRACTGRQNNRRGTAACSTGALPGKLVVGLGWRKTVSACSNEFKVRGTEPAVPAARKSWSPRHREVIGVA